MGMLLAACGDDGLAAGRDGGTRDGGTRDASADLGTDVGDAGSIDSGRDAGSSGLCEAAPGSLIPGELDALDGLAPPGWQVRDPAAPGRCGDASEHVYLTDGPCGTALAIDARGEWDCYAVQAFTDYSTIEPGATYRLSFAARSEGQDNPAGWFMIGVQWLDGSDGVFGNEQNPEQSPLDFGWKRIDWDLVAPAEARRAVVWLTAHYPGRVDFDALSLTRLD